MDPILMSMEDAETITSSPVIGRYLGVAVGVPVAAVELGNHDGAEIARRLSQLPVVTVGVGSSPDHAWDIRCENPLPIFEGVLANPIAAVTAAQVLRGAENRSVPDALLMESLAYATLQSGPEFAAWLETQGRRVRDNEDPRIQVHEHAERVDVILDRPRLFNLVDAQMRDELIDIFRVLAERPDLAIGLSGAGTVVLRRGRPRRVRHRRRPGNRAHDSFHRQPRGVHPPGRRTSHSSSTRPLHRCRSRDDGLL